MSNTLPTYVVTPTPVRFSYPHLFEPYASIDGKSDPKYSLTLLIPKSDGALVQMLGTAIEAARQAGIAGIWKGVAPAQPSVSFYDGDGVTPNGEAWGEECRGHYILRTSSKQPPVVVNQQCQKILDSSQIYAGCWGYVGLNFYPYDTAGKRGIGAGLNNVMFARDGEPLGNMRTAAEDFASLVANAPPAAQMPYPQSAPPPNFPQQVAPQAYTQPSPPQFAFPATASQANTYSPAAQSPYPHATPTQSFPQQATQQGYPQQTSAVPFYGLPQQ